MGRKDQQTLPGFRGFMRIRPSSVSGLSHANASCANILSLHYSPGNGRKLTATQSSNPRSSISRQRTAKWKDRNEIPITRMRIAESGRGTGTTTSADSSEERSAFPLGSHVQSNWGITSGVVCEIVINFSNACQRKWNTH